MVLLTLTYLYFWWMVIKATAHGHVSRELVTGGILAESLAHAKREGNTHRFLIQITTKGGALSVVQRGVDNVIDAVTLYPALRPAVWVEIVTENADEVASLRNRYRDSVVPVIPHLLPADYRTPKDTRLKARALEYMVEQHRAEPTDSYVVHYDEESVFTPDNLARLVHRLSRHPVGISEGMISYGLDWNETTLLNKAMESNRPFGCHECYSVMTSPPPMHLHGSNLVIRQDLENQIGWDIGNLNGSALIAEDLVFGLAAYLKFGKKAFGWHHAEMIEQPPFTLRAAYKQRERWVFGAMQALEHIRHQSDWTRLSRRDRWHINIVIRLRVLTYAIGFPVSLLALGSNVVMLLVLATEAVREGRISVVAPELTVYGIITAIGLVLWMAGTQLGLFYNLRLRRSHRYGRTARGGSEVARRCSRGGVEADPEAGRAERGAIPAHRHRRRRGRGGGRHGRRAGGALRPPFPYRQGRGGGRRRRHPRRRLFKVGSGHDTALRYCLI